MAINPQKLLPQSNSSIVKVSNTFSSAEFPTDKKDKKSNFSSLLKELLIIKNKTSNIEKILKNNLNLQKANDKILRKGIENTRFAKKEKKLEEKKDTKDKKESKGVLPQLGIFDRINRFITFTFLGWLTNKFFKYLPQILEFTKKIGPVVNFFETLSGNIFKGFVDFIDFGYDAYDKVRDFTKTLGGEPFQKAFDDFSKNLNTFVNLAIVAGMAATGGTDFGLGKGGKPGTPSRPGQGARPRVTTSGGGAAGRPDIRNPLRGGPRVTTSGGGAAGTPNIRNPLRSGPRVTTSGGSAAGRFAGIGGRIPIIGGLVSFIINILSGEPVGRAAAKAVGFSIGSALGTFVPVPFVGTILGGMLGDIVGGALYDTLVSNKPEKREIKAKSKGGQVTSRGGKKVGGAVARTLKIKRRSISPPKAQPIRPGESVGGKKKFQSMFPEPKGEQIGKSMNPYGFVTNTANEFSNIGIIGALSTVFTKPLLGQLPTKQDYRNFGLAINAWINNAILKGTLKGNLVKGFADGGIIDNNMTRDISSWAEKSLEEMIKDKVTKAINDLRKNLGLEPLSGTGEGTPGDFGEGFGVDVSSDSPDFWLLATAAMFENSDPQGAADVGQAIYNRVAMPGDPWKVNNSIRKAILNPGQFQPVSDYGGASVWNRIKTKEDAVRFATSKGKTQAQLETVAAALLDKNKQQSARQFVGPRDSFRSYSFEDANNHLANETEIRRLGHAFGFEPRGSTIGLFKAGKLTAAQVGEGVRGTVSAGNGKFIQGNSGASEGIHFHIGPGSYEKGDLKDPKHNASAREVAFKVIKHFLGKKSLYHGRTGVSYSGSEDDATIKKMIQTEQVVHTGRGSQGGIDIQVGGAYWPGAKVAFPFAVENMKYRPGGYGVAAKVAGFNAFVAHGAYDEKGRKAPQELGNLYKGGGIIGSDKTPRNTKPLEYDPDYSQDYIIMIQPILKKVMVPVPVPSGGRSSTIFSGDLNNMNSSMFVS